MQASIQSRLTFGLGFLFFIILLLSGVGGYFLHQLARGAETTLHDNYRSVAYARHLADALADLREARLTDPTSPAATRARQTFARNLAAEQANITEPGEGRLADSLATGFAQYLGTGPATEAARAGYQQLRGQAGRVAALNLRAIEQQSQRTHHLANRTIGLLGLLAALGLLATFSFIFSFPAYVARPVDELTAGIRRLAAGDYRQRLSTTTYPDFAEVARAFNDMAHKLESYETADGTPRIDSSGPVEFVTTHRRPGSPAAAPANLDPTARQQLGQQLREQARQLRRTAEALLAGTEAGA